MAQEILDRRDDAHGLHDLAFLGDPLRLVAGEDGEYPLARLTDAAERTVRVARELLGGLARAVASAIICGLSALRPLKMKVGPRERYSSPVARTTPLLTSSATC